MSRLIWNAQKIFRIDIRKPCDLHPLKIIEGMYLEHSAAPVVAGFSLVLA
jgi:DNA-directed RNA polymerase II subunit RPB1